MVVEGAGGRVGTRYMCMLMSYGNLLFYILTENLIMGKTDKGAQCTSWYTSIEKW